MKRFLICSVMAAAVCCLALTGCGKKDIYTGEYSYTQYGTNYGIRVQVAVDNGKISGVKVASSDFVAVSEPMGEWTQEDVDNWKNNLNALLKAYEGRTVEEVLAEEVAVSSDGAPLVKGDEGFKNYDSTLLISGSTLGSGRLLLAVQNALKQY